MLDVLVMSYMLHGTTILRTVTVDQLIDAIGAVESGSGAAPANVYQLTPIYVEDVCRITGQRLTLDQAIEDDEMARACIRAYWAHYGDVYHVRCGKSADAEALARIHNGGPDGWRKPETAPYWRKVCAELAKRSR